MPIPKKPYRDTALIYGAFAVVVVVFVGATGGTLLPRRVNGHFVIGALPIALGCFLLATAYSWWRFKKRLEEERRHP